MDDDNLKLIALIIAVEERTKHNITNAPALLDESFRNSFAGAGGAMLALTNNADLVSAAETSRMKFQNVSGRGGPLERTLAHFTDATPAASSVGDTHARSSGSGIADLTMESEAPPATSPIAETRTPDQLHLSQDEAAVGPATALEEVRWSLRGAETLMHNLSPGPAHIETCASRAMAAARCLHLRRLYRESLWTLPTVGDYSPRP